MRFVPLLLSVLILTGCMTHGAENISDIGRYLSLEKGKSTKTDVYRLFGQPHAVLHDSERSIWTYYKVERSISAWTLIPFVGIITGGDDFRVTTAKFSFEKGDFRGLETKEHQTYENMWIGLVRPLALRSREAEIKKEVVEEMERLRLPFDEEKWTAQWGWAPGLLAYFIESENGRDSHGDKTAVRHEEGP
jgi:hypothetical protein